MQILRVLKGVCVFLTAFPPPPFFPSGWIGDCLDSFLGYFLPASLLLPFSAPAPRSPHPPSSPSFSGVSQEDVPSCCDPLATGGRLVSSLTRGAEPPPPDGLGRGAPPQSQLRPPVHSIGGGGGALPHRSPQRNPEPFALCRMARFGDEMPGLLRGGGSGAAAGWSWAPEAGEEPGAAGRAGSPGPKGWPSSQWRRERGPWPLTTPSPSDRTASRSTGLYSFFSEDNGEKIRQKITEWPYPCPNPRQLRLLLPRFPSSRLGERPGG